MRKEFGFFSSSTRSYWISVENSFGLMVNQGSDRSSSLGRNDIARLSMSVTEKDGNENEQQEMNSLERGGIIRSTVARKCRDFYMQRLQRTEMMQRRWSMCSPMETIEDEPVIRQSSESDAESELSTNSDSASDSNATCDSFANSVPESLPGSEKGCSPAPLRKWKSTFDLAMDNLRKEISSLVAQDNDLFKQLLSLNDSIAELRDQQRRSLELSQLDDEDFSDCSRSPSLESLSDPDTVTTTSPASTLSSSCSSSHHSCRRIHEKTTNRHFTRDETSSRTRSTSATLCLRCRTNGKMTAAPLYKRRALSHADWRRDDFDSYDSGIHLHGSHSDSDHEIFV